MKIIMWVTRAKMGTLRFAHPTCDARRPVAIIRGDVGWAKASLCRWGGGGFGAVPIVCGEGYHVGLLCVGIKAGHTATGGDISRQSKNARMP